VIILLKTLGRIQIHKFKLIALLIVLALGLLFSSTAYGEAGVIPEDNRNIIADLASEVEDGVVMISTETEVDVAQDLPFEDDPFFEFFFPDRDFEEDPEPREGFGSGFIVTADGHVVTNEHVVGQADEVKVTIKGEDESRSAEVLWADRSLDLAVLQVETDGDELSPLPLADSDEIRQGDWAIAIGNPLGFDHTVTVGVVSALGRPINVPTPEGIRTYQNLIQTDAAINPGNSGGPLLNIDGEVIGINTAVAMQAQGIGFAIPVNEVKFALDDLEEYGEVRMPWIGIYYQQLTPEVADYLDVQAEEGIIIMDVVPDSPAEEAGLEPYDVVTEFDEEPITTTDDFARMVSKQDVGNEVMLRIERAGEPQLIILEIGQRPEEF